MGSGIARDLELAVVSKAKEEEEEEEEEEERKQPHTTR